LCLLFETGKGIITNEFNKLMAIAKNQPTREYLENLTSEKIFNFISYYAEKTKYEFYIYDLNIFETPKIANLKIEKFLEILQMNLKEIDNLENGDMIGKKALIKVFQKFILLTRY
jgi:transcription initiation factor IIE alpha subunit